MTLSVIYNCTKYTKTTLCAVLFILQQCSNAFTLSITAYKDLQSREDTRNGAWQQEGWDEVVYYTGEETTNLISTSLVILSALTFINIRRTLNCEDTPNKL